MCILAGCDYLPSIKGMGVKKAQKLLSSFASVHDVHCALQCSAELTGVAQALYSLRDKPKKGKKTKSSNPIVLPPGCFADCLL